MENASKALIIAVSVLLGVMIISVAVYAFKQFSLLPKHYEEQLSQQRQAAYNSKFLVYDGLKTVSAHEVITICNLAKENNTNYEVSKPSDGPFYITVEIDGTSFGKISNMEQKTDDYYYQFLNVYADAEKDSNGKVKLDSEGAPVFYTFTCTGITTSEETKQVEKITFKLNK